MDFPEPQIFDEEAVTGENYRNILLSIVLPKLSKSMFHNIFNYKVLLYDFQ